MASLIAVSLICAASIAVQDCTIETALDILQTPVDRPLPSACIAIGQIAAAGAHLIDPEDHSRYVRVDCKVRRAVAAAEPPR